MGPNGEYGTKAEQQMRKDLSRLPNLIAEYEAMGIPQNEAAKNAEKFLHTQDKAKAKEARERQRNSPRM